MKSISAFIATVLLIIAAVAIGGILMLYFSGYFKGTQQQVSGTVEEFQKCSKGTIYLDVINIKQYGNTLEIPITNGISQNLYDFTFVIKTTVTKYELKPQNQRTQDNPLKPGEQEIFKVVNPAGFEGKIEGIKIVATCLTMKIEREFTI